MSTTQTEEGVRAQVRAFLQQEFLYLRPDLVLGDDDDLLDLGVLDSMGMVELVEEVQQRWGLVVQDAEITEENFGSVAAVAGFVSRRSA